jgi:hypothetical protein
MELFGEVCDLPDFLDSSSLNLSLSFNIADIYFYT